MGTYVGSFATPNKKDLQHLKECDHGELPPCPHGRRCPALEKLKKDNTSINKQLLITYRNNHKRLFSHPPKQRKLAATHEEQSPFSYEANFAKMHPLDLRAIDPLEQLQDPRRALKVLVQEVIEKGPDKKPALADGVKISDLKSLQYITNSELPWLETVEEILYNIGANEVGASLNMVELFALKLYTDWTDCCYELGKAQRSGNFEIWPIWDHFLMRAILKLHRAELAKGLKVKLRKKAKLYSGLHNVQLDGERIGFFKTYTSTTLEWNVANTFMDSKGMIISLNPKMIRQFVNCDVSWISCFKHESEILFARSADVGLYPAPKWKGTITGYYKNDPTMQKVAFNLAYPVLIVRKGETQELPSAPFHKFSYIKIEENATLTIAPWQPDNQQGGRLQIHCFGACILEKNAKIDVSGKGYAGGTRKHPKGYGKGGGHSNDYCAAGGSYTTQGGSGQCRNAFTQINYHAKQSSTYGHALLTSKALPLGSGGGYIQYDSSEGAQGSRGGGALYLEVRGDLHLGNGAHFLADGADADPLSGGAGSGGSICIKVNGDLIQAATSIPRFSVQGGNTFYPITQGKGGHGKITLYIAQHEKIITYWLRKYDHIANAIKPYIPIITTFLLNHQASKYSLSRKSSLAPTKERMIHSMQNLFSSQKNTLSIDHITVSIHYHNAQGIAHTAQAHYQKAVQYHDKALELAQSKYGIKQPHPDIANAYAHKGQTLEAQGNYQAAIAAHQKELKIVRQVYKQDPSHPKIIQAHTHLSIAYQGQGQDELAKKALNNVITTWEKNKKAQSRAAIATAYDQRGVAYHHQGNYPKAMNDHIEAQKIRNDLHGNIDHLDLVASYQYIGQAHHDQGNTSAAIDFYNKALKMLHRLYPSQANRPDMAAIHTLLGKVYHSQGQYKQAIASQEKALRMYKEVYHNQNHPDIADVLYYLALSYHGQGDYDLATYYYQKAIEMLRALHKQRDTLDALFSYLLQQGISQQNVQQCKQWLHANEVDDEALIQDVSDFAQSNIAAYHPTIYPLLKQFLQEQTPTTLDEPFHPAIADALEQQGNTYLYFGNATKALQNHKKAQTIRKLAYSDPAHPNHIASCNSIARFYLHQKQYQQALQILNKGVQTWKQQHDTRAHPVIALTYRLRGLAYYNQANYASARQEHQMSLSLYKKLYGDNPHPAIADDHHAIANTYAKEGKYKDDALPHYKKALKIREQIYSDIPYHPAIAAALNAIGTTYAAIGYIDQAIENHAKATYCQLQHFCKANQIDHTLTLYVPTDASKEKALDNNKPKETQIFPLHPRVKQFIRDTNSTVLLLHGDAGAGKSLYGRFLENELWATYQEKNKSIIPLFISLPALKDPIHHAVTETLTQYGWDNTTIQALKKQSYQHYSQHQKGKGQQLEDDSKEDEKTDTQSTEPRVLIFLDGYDEINATQNLYQTNQLAQWGAKVMIGCRTEYLDQLDNYRHYFQADAELYIRPFNPKQIDTYLDRIDNTTEQNKATQKTTWHKTQYKAKFEEMAELKALSTSPFLLQLIVTALPHLPNRTQITRADIYRTFIDQWITTAVNRMAQQGMENISKAACWQYGMEVALFMFLHQRVTMQASTTSLKEGGLCKHFSDDEKECHYTGAPFFAEANTLLRKALPLKQLSKTTSSFLHKSIQEYCAAQALLQSVAQLSPRSPNELTTYFAKKVKAYDPINNKTTPALNQKLLNAAPAIIHFLVDELAPTAQHPVWREWLFAIIEASKKNPQVAIAAANSVTILNAGGISLACKNWAGIHIPNALLDHACLAHTNLQGANLAHVSLRQAYLEAIQCQKANVHNIQFGEYPTLPHTSYVRSVSWSPDGKRLASASGGYRNDNSVRIWDVASGKQLQLCAGHKDRVNSVSWSPDGKRLASASSDNSVRIWDVASGKQLQRCAGHDSIVNSVSWSPDGKRLASASSDNSVRIWDVASGKQLQLCAGHSENVQSVSWSPEGKRLASASSDNSVRIWDVASGKQLQLCAGHSENVQSVSWSPEGKRLASASEDYSVRIWDVASGKQLQLCAGHTYWVNSVSWSPEGKRLASASSDNSVRIWDVASGKQLQLCAGHTWGVSSVSWSPDGKRLASASDDISVRIWDVASGKQLQLRAGHTSEVNSVSWSPDGTRLASASSDKSVRIWDVASGKQLQLCAGHDRGVLSVSWSPDGKRLASASSDNSVRIWDVASGKQLQRCAGHKDRVNSVSWSLDGKRLASASGRAYSNDNSVRIWDVASGKQLQLCAGHTDWVNSVSWSPDGKRLASASYDKSVRIWDVASGKQLQLCAGHIWGVYSVSWSPDGKRLASASNDKSVRIWDVASGKQLQLCAGHTSFVWSVSWSPDGKRLASASNDNSVRIWDVASGKQLQLCAGHNSIVSIVTSVSWSPDGKRLASASDDKSVRIWDEKKGKVMRIISNETPLTLTDANFTGAIGLSPTYKQLVQQRGGIVEEKKW